LLWDCKGRHFFLLSNFFFENIYCPIDFLRSEK